MAKLTIVTFTAFFIIVLFTLFDCSDGVPFEPQIDNELSDEFEIESDTALMIKSREKRDIISSMANTIWDIIAYPFRMISNFFGGVYNFMSSLVMAPINFIGDIFGGFIDLILSPFRLIYQAITWPFRFLFSSSDRDELEDATNNPSSSSTEGDDGSTFLERAQDALRDWLIDLLWKGWDVSKEYIFPRLDELIVTITDSNLVPENIESALSTIHSVYEMLHMLRIL